MQDLAPDDASLLCMVASIRAKRSFSFFVRAILGHRHFEKGRLEALAARQVEPVLKFEQALLLRWQRLREQGEVPSGGAGGLLLRGL